MYIYVSLCGVMVNILDYDAKERGSSPTDNIGFTTYITYGVIWTDQ